MALNATKATITPIKYSVSPPCHRIFSSDIEMRISVGNLRNWGFDLDQGLGAFRRGVAANGSALPDTFRAQLRHRRLDALAQDPDQLVDLGLGDDQRR